MRRAWFPGAALLDAILRVVHDTEDGLVEEDVEELRASALVRRHFSDPFEEPEVRRFALADTLVGEEELAREGVELTEVRREAAGAFVVVTRLHARAELSAEIPLLGLLRSWTRSEVTTESASGERARRRPPLTNENSLACLGSGRGAKSTLPDGIDPRN